MTWLESVENYSTSTWYPAGISWTYDDKWRLHENILEMRDPLLENPEAYSFRGVTEVIAPVPWRVTYTIQKMDPAHSDKEMTPYSDVRFAVYRIDDGVAVFDRAFVWQTLYGRASAERGRLRQGTTRSRSCQELRGGCGHRVSRQTG